MKSYRRRVASTDPRLRCSVCGLKNDPRKVPAGGQHYPVVLTTTVDSTTVYYAGTYGGGCRFCGSPAWRLGGKAGDLATPFGSRR